MNRPLKADRAEALAMEYARKKAEKLGIDPSPEELVTEYAEQFNSLRNDLRADVITDVRVVCDAGIDPDWKGAE